MILEADKKLFDTLKKSVADRFLQENKVENLDYATWKGQEIVSFQEDFFKKVKSSFSEKWFYSYFKQEPKKLPRIDMLNLLAEYAGFQNWATFKQSIAQPNQIIIDNKITIAPPQNDNFSFKSNSKIVKWSIFGIFLPIVLSSLFFLYKELNTNEVQFCFIDETTNEIIKTEPIDLTIFQKGESPAHYRVEKGCFDWESTEDTIKMVIKSPYHKRDTIVKTLKNKDTENIKLATDYYALMIHYVSTSNVKDWQKNRNYIRKVIANDALIYQIYDSQGIEMYNKEEFINKLTLATKSLKSINILDIQYHGGKIQKLTFKTN